MCGIVGYIGEKQAAPKLMEGLTKLEYRGYDSAGIAVYNEGRIQLEKAEGRLQVLKDLTHNGEDVQGVIGIGHTRWATHGAPSDVNAHPHCNKDKTISIVHNGIIENYQQLRKALQEKGYEFQSETDSEVVVQLIDYYYEGDLVEAMNKVMTRIEGSYAIAAIATKNPDQIVAVRKDCPLVIGPSKEGNFIASDVTALLKYTRDVYFIEDNEIVSVTKDKIEILNRDLEPIKKELTTIGWDVSAAEKGGYPHFMFKEIAEQPKAFKDTVNPRIRDGKIVIDEVHLSEGEIKNLKKIYLIGCGSAYHAGVVGKYVIENMNRIPVEVDLASEFRYRNPIFEENSIVIVISQSGETADTLAALREAKKNGIRTLAIVNVVGSSIARDADDVIYTWAGPEIAVATTKAYSTQLSALYLLSMYFGQVRGNISTEEEEKLINELETIPEKMSKILENEEKIQYFASKYVGAKDIFFIGRGVDYAASLEGSLKLKEISYIHSEAYAAGELKHGTISLIEDGTLVIALLTQEHLYPKMISNMVELKARGAYVLAVTNESNKEVEKTANFVLYVPDTASLFAPSLAALPLQLFAYYVAVGKGCDVDKPRNLAKSVTVE